MSLLDDCIAFNLVLYHLKGGHSFWCIYSTGLNENYSDIGQPSSFRRLLDLYPHVDDVQQLSWVQCQHPPTQWEGRQMKQCLIKYFFFDWDQYPTLGKIVIAAAVHFLMKPWVDFTTRYWIHRDRKTKRERESSKLVQQSTNGERSDWYINPVPRRLFIPALQ